MHPNSQKRIYFENSIYFVTTKTKGNYPYFRDNVLAKLCVSKIMLAQEWMRFILYGFVILPDHLHILIMPKGKYTISQIMHNIKRNTSRSANIWLAHHYSVGEDDHPRPRVQRRFKRFSSFYDHIIRDESDLFNHLEYMKINPFKHGVVKEGKDCPYVRINHSEVGKL